MKKVTLEVKRMKAQRKQAARPAPRGRGSPPMPPTKMTKMMCRGEAPLLIKAAQNQRTTYQRITKEYLIIRIGRVECSFKEEVEGSGIQESRRGIQEYPTWNKIQHSALVSR